MRCCKKWWDGLNVAFDINWLQDCYIQKWTKINDIFMKTLTDMQIFEGSDFGPNDQVYCEAALRFYFNSSLNQVYNGDKEYTSLT